VPLWDDIYFVSRARVTRARSQTLVRGSSLSATAPSCDHHFLQGGGSFVVQAEGALDLVVVRLDDARLI